MKLNLGSGPSKMDGFLGVDSRDFGQDIVADLRDTWKWEDNSVDEVHASHFIEHLTGPERIHFVNELYRVLKPGAKATVITPHWASNRAYGDLTHQWPPVSEMWFYYLSRDWRTANAPHNDFYTCDFACTWGYSLNAAIIPRNTEYQQHALAFWKEAAQDIIATMVKTAPRSVETEYALVGQTGG